MPWYVSVPLIWMGLSFALVSPLVIPVLVRDARRALARRSQARRTTPMVVR